MEPLRHLGLDVFSVGEERAGDTGPRNDESGGRRDQSAASAARGGHYRAIGSILGCFCIFLLGVAGGVTGGPAAAQEVAVPTLHVYTDLIQIPVLVLSPKRARVSPIAPEKFYLSIDSGPLFRATHVRQEGEDPISLSVVVDLSGPEAKLLPELERVLASTAPPFLLPHDHISIYALDCSLMKSVTDIPAEPGQLKRAMDEVFQPWKQRATAAGTARCSQGVPLWDGLTRAIGELSVLPGRRVILAATDGRDLGSRYLWNQVRFWAQAKGVAIFGVSYWPNSAPRYSEDVFNSVCELSGGLVLRADEVTAADQLKLFTTMLRERYIVEFPRPSNGTSGQHGLAITVKKSHGFIRAAGISVPLPDPALLADPSTIPSDPSRAPVQGSRRTLTKPR